MSSRTQRQYFDYRNAKFLCMSAFLYQCGRFNAFLRMWFFSKCAWSCVYASSMMDSYVFFFSLEHTSEVGEKIILTGTQSRCLIFVCALSEWRH